jgi:hypothetical protein
MFTSISISTSISTSICIRAKRDTARIKKQHGPPACLHCIAPAANGAPLHPSAPICSQSRVIVQQYQLAVHVQRARRLYMASSCFILLVVPSRTSIKHVIHGLKKQSGSKRRPMPVMQSNIPINITQHSTLNSQPPHPPHSLHPCPQTSPCAPESPPSSSPRAPHAPPPSQTAAAAAPP